MEHYGVDDPGVCCRTKASQFLWLLGHPFSVAYALQSLAMVQQWVQNVPRTAGQEHYFTADTGPTVFNSRTMTQDILQRVQHGLAGHVADGYAAATSAPAAFALDKNLYTVSALLVAGLAGGYALVDLLPIRSC